LRLKWASGRPRGAQAVCLTAKTFLRRVFRPTGYLFRDLFRHESFSQLKNFSGFQIHREMSGIKNMNFCSWIIALISLGPGDRE
jgi:hypothetical protein